MKSQKKEEIYKNQNYHFFDEKRRPRRNSQNRGKVFLILFLQVFEKFFLFGNFSFGKFIFGNFFC